MKKEKSHLQHIADASYKRAYAREYYEANKDKARKYYKKHDVLIKARAALWRLENRERYLKQQAEYDKTKRKYPAGEDTHPLDQKPGENQLYGKKGYYPPLI